MTNLPKAMATPYATLRLFAGAPRVFLKHLCYERLDGQKIQQCANLNVDYFETLRMFRRAREQGLGAKEAPLHCLILVLW